MISAYDSSSKLRFSDFIIPSEEGAQQGDPLGLLLFCLAIHDLLLSLRSELVLGYLDDITIGGEPDSVAKDFILLESKAAEIGLKLK